MSEGEQRDSAGFVKIPVESAVEIVKRTYYENIPQTFSETSPDELDLLINEIDLEIDRLMQEDMIYHKPDIQDLAYKMLMISVMQDQEMSAEEFARQQIQQRQQAAGQQQQPQPPQPPQQGGGQPPQGQQSPQGQPQQQGPQQQPQGPQGGLGNQPADEEQVEEEQEEEQEPQTDGGIYKKGLAEISKVETKGLIGVREDSQLLRD